MADEGTLNGADVRAEGLADWRMMINALYARFETGGFATGLRLVARIGEAAEAADHHPDIDLRYGLVEVKLTSHDVAGITRRDVNLARQISALAAELAVTAMPDAVSVVELGLDTPDADEIRPFWQAMYGLSDGDVREGEVVDPKGTLPTLWFQQTEPHEVPKQRFHLDVWVPHDEADQRREAVLAAGGTLVSDEEAPAFWVFADAQGNRACICTNQSRDR